MSVYAIDTSLAQTARVWRITTPLEGTEYALRFYWSTREARWYLSVLSQSGAVLAANVAVVVAGTNAGPNYKGLLAHFLPNANVPPGRFVALDMSGLGAEIAAQTDLGTRVSLLYATSDEF